ncbi:MAG TPA: MBL fold metallo-hydrolase [Bacteroidales bacterium]|nr:MBL fold metallo-hydrolase [Bacteroidales bacterium]HPF02658.1 MBL fold metallo-hydrolase [Bacteroidales bacterium]HPJ60515.1 MBL fold metallo-hydrolase [Bacteroidales bacterium]HPR13416.1 MBL fold metallo-hydrolase [Bacteroidales bacterium]HRW84965.1 MBL fold metallo-hydrolase [Bacteroidales bacterium]
MEVFRLIFSPIEVNTYILSDGSGKCAVIDCGCYSRDEFDRLARLIDSKKLVPELLLNTHCHLDHIFGNRMFLERYGTGTLCHIEEDVNRNDSVHIAELFGLEMETAPAPADYIDDNSIVSFGITHLQAILVPGHTAGSLAFYSEKDSIVFTGDALFAGSIGRTDLKGGNYNTLVAGIRNRLFSLPAGTIVYPGHGESTTIEAEINTNPYFT